LVKRRGYTTDTEEGGRLASLRARCRRETAIDEAKLKQDWLVNNAVVAFVGAVLMAQAWHMPEGTVKLLFVITVPNYTGLVIFAITAGLFVLSMFLILATLVPKLQQWAFPLGLNFSLTLGLLGWIAFLIGFASAVPDLPSDQWWSWFLIVGGFVLVVFLAARLGATAWSNGKEDG